MVKKETIYRILHTQIRNAIEPYLAPLGFKYIKGKKAFVGPPSNFHYTVTIRPQYIPLEYNEDTEELKIKFELDFVIDFPEYQKWCNSITGVENPLIEEKISSVECFYLLDLFTTFQDEDFYSPTKAVLFKRAITGSLVSIRKGSNQRQNEYSLEEFLSKHLSGHIEKLRLYSDINKLIENRKDNLSSWYVNMLVFDGQIEKATEYYDLTYKASLNYIENLLATSRGEAALRITSLDSFIKRASQYIKKEYSNPFTLATQVISSENNVITINTDIVFKELLRIDCSVEWIYYAYVHLSTNELYLQLSNQSIEKYSLDGKLLLRFQSPYPDYSRRHELSRVENTEWMHFYNDIFTEDNKILHLDLPAKDFGKKPVLFSIKYYPVQKQYIAIFYPNYEKFAGILCFYNEDLELESQIDLEGGPLEIILEKQLIMTELKDNRYLFYNFSGQLLFDFSGKNCGYRFSPDNRYVVFHSWGSQSTILNLETNKSKTIRAHPTNLKGYKEKFYSDTEHSFHMGPAYFSPDESFFIHNSTYGKVVAFSIPDFKSNDLIPMEHFKLGEIVEFEGQTIYVPKNDRLDAIIFLEDEMFLTQEKGLGLIWDKKFKNIGHFTAPSDPMRNHNGSFISTKSRERFVLYKREL